MSNQFYNYIAEELINYWKSNKIHKGNRYFLRLEEREEVIAMAEALKSANPEIVKEFHYEHEMGEAYHTAALQIDDVKLVIAYTSDEVKTDYLALVRNLVSEQKQGWENTALISIVSEQLDTIPGGSLDLQSEGMPLHPEALFETIQKKIANSSLTKAEKLILIDNLEKIVQDHKVMRLSIFEFEEILTTLYKGQISVEDYKELGMFADPDLDSFSGKSLKNRIHENRELYELVRQANEYNQTEEYLQKKFTVDGAKKMMDEGWQEIPFTEVLKDHQKFLSENKTMKVTLEEISTENGEVLWDRPGSDTASGKRKRHIIVFNPTHNEEISLIAKFSLQGSIKSLNGKYVKGSAKDLDALEVDVKTTNIHITIKADGKKPVFGKFTYKHEDRVSLGAEFHICVLPIGSYLFEAVNASYRIDSKNQCLVLKANGNRLTLGKGHPITDLDMKENEATFPLEEFGQYNIVISPELFEEEGDLRFFVKINDTFVPILIDSELADSMPIQGSRIWKLVRESMSDMIWVKELNRLMHNHREYYLQSSYSHFFEWEYKWLDEGMRHGKIRSGSLFAEDIALSEELREAYSRFIAYFKTPAMIPSITHVSEEYAARAKEYVRAYIKEVEGFANGVPAGKKGVHLYHLGTIEADDTMYITPFHPLMVAYKLKMYEQLGNEEIDNVILSRLSPEALLPFIEKDELYRPQHQDDAPEWLVLKSVNRVTVADSVQYLANVITDKMKQFKEHFGYLFTESSKAPILINVMNLPDDQQVLKGILNFMIREINNKGIQSLKPIEVTLYTDSPINSAFEYFANLKTTEQVEEYIDLKLKTKELDADTVLRTLRENLFFYRRMSTNHQWELRYAHITFYKMHAQESSARQSMKEMRSDLALEGLYASVPAMRDAETYKSGFGVKNYRITEGDYLIKTAYYVNELIANSRNEGNDSYVKGNTVLSRVDTADENTLLEIFDHSHWVTFIDPTVDLEFFKNFNNDIVVIHYSDQYTSSNKFDAITVTNKSGQYYKVIKEFLQNKEIEGNEQNIKNTIRAFNTFNGEWLLRIIGTKGYADREKLSIISAIKYTLAYLDHPNIKWIPISLEEILRVAGVFNLSKAGGIFSAKNLGLTGPASDDLLLIGLEELEGSLYMHFYPVEVKFGLNGTGVIAKAKEQVKQTKELLLNTLTKDFRGTFKEKFYKNFFVQLLLSNANKMVQGDIWLEKDYQIRDELIEKLVKLDFEVSDHLSEVIGKGMVVSFQEGLLGRSSYIEDDINIINFSKEDGFVGIVKEMETIYHWLHQEETDFIKERFLVNVYHQQALPETAGTIEESHVEKLPDEENIFNEVLENISVENELDSAIKAGYTYEVSPSLQDAIVEDDQIEEEEEQAKILSSWNEELPKQELELPILDDKNKEESTSSSSPSIELKDIRIKLGKEENSNREVYWEYGHPELANRHLLISGKSGQGKTYFMQCLLLEKSKQGLSSIIIDYTEGFLPTQLEPEFVEALGDRLKQRIVYLEKLPINPFSRNVRQIGAIELPETNTDIAERVKSVFSAVYGSLGIQQLNTIYDRVLVGLDRYDQNMSLSYLKELLEEDGSNTALKTLSQIRPLIDRDPFTNEDTIDWKEIIDAKGDVFVIQLTGYPRDVQLIITEFILWDLWNFSVRKGNKNMPMPVVMDEAQNLDHTEESPSARVLTEGRKFGWSAWYATQFLKAQMDSSELARLQMASQKIYFAQSDEDVSYIANTMVNEVGDRRYWEAKLLSLKKGQCIVQGPQLDSNGKLTKTKTVIVNISPLTNRI